MSTPRGWPAPTSPTVLQQLALRFGRRGLKLMVLGLGFVMYGISIVTGPHVERFSRPGRSPLDWADSRAWGWLFVAGGTAAVVIGARRRWAPDAWGFAGLQVPATIWACLYGVSFIIWMGTGGDYGEPRTWAGMGLWTILAVSIRIDAGWDDPTDPVGGWRDGDGP